WNAGAGAAAEPSTSAKTAALTSPRHLEAPAGPRPISGDAREFVAIAIRDKVLTKAEVDAAVAAAPDAALRDSTQLANVLVGARVLARPQALLIETGMYL